MRFAAGRERCSAGRALAMRRVRFRVEPRRRAFSLFPPSSIMRTMRIGSERPSAHPTQGSSELVGGEPGRHLRRFGLAPAAHSTNADAVATADAIAATVVAYATDPIPTVVRHARPVIAAVVADATNTIPA